MPLIRTFSELANQHEELGQYLEAIAAASPKEQKADICDAIVTLTCDNPQNPLRGQSLWDRLNELFPYDGSPCFINLLNAVVQRIGDFKSLAADIAANPNIRAFPESWKAAMARHLQAVAVEG